MTGARHPLVAHPVGPLAVEVLRGGFGLGLGGKHRLLSAMAGVLGHGGSFAEPCQKAGNDGHCLEKRLTTPHGRSVNNNHSGRGAPGVLARSPARLNDHSGLAPCRLKGKLQIHSQMFGTDVIKATELDVTPSLASSFQLTKRIDDQSTLAELH